MSKRIQEQDVEFFKLDSISITRVKKTGALQCVLGDRRVITPMCDPAEALLRISLASLGYDHRLASGLVAGSPLRQRQGIAQGSLRKNRDDDYLTGRLCPDCGQSPSRVNDEEHVFGCPREEDP